MRTHKASLIAITKARHILIVGNGEIRMSEFETVCDMCMFSKFWLFEIAYNLGYLRGMKHDPEKTEIRKID